MLALPGEGQSLDGPMASRPIMSPQNSIGFVSRMPRPRTTQRGSAAPARQGVREAQAPRRAGARNSEASSLADAGQHPRCATGPAGQERLAGRRNSRKRLEEDPMPRPIQGGCGNSMPRFEDPCFEGPRQQKSKTRKYTPLRGEIWGGRLRGDPSPCSKSVVSLFPSLCVLPCPLPQAPLLCLLAPPPSTTVQTFVTWGVLFVLNTQNRPEM